MKITRRALRRIIKEEKAKLLEYEQYVDEEGNVYDDEGNQTKIAAIELAISERPDNFLKSILSQLNTGRRLSAKQNTIIRKILSKPVYSADAALFEQSARKMRITKRQLRKIIREETATIDYDTADEVETKEDVWSGGDNLSLSLDPSKVVGSEAVTAEPEILSLTERQLRDAIRDATKRAR